MNIKVEIGSNVSDEACPPDFGKYSNQVPSASGYAFLDQKCYKNRGIAIILRKLYPDDPDFPDWDLSERF